MLKCSLKLPTTDEELKYNKAFGADTPVIKSREVYFLIARVMLICSSVYLRF